MTTSVRDEVGQVVVDYLAQHSTEPTPDYDEDLFESGRVNSLFAVQLISFLQSRFGIDVTVDDLDLANFSTVNKVVDFVTRKQTGG